MIRNLFSVFLTLFLFRWKILRFAQNDRFIFLFWIIFFIEMSPAWGLAPQTQIERDFDVGPIFQLSEAEAEKINRLMRPAPYVVFDFEANGRDPSQAKPIEIAALKFEGTRLVGKFYSLIDPGEKLDPVVKQMTGLTEEMLRGQPTVDQVIPRFAEFIQGCELVGHHIQKYDIPMLETHLERFGLLYPQKPFVHDTKALVERLIPRQELGRFTLEKVAEAAGSPIPANHSALSDVVANTFAFWHLKQVEERVRNNFYARYRQNRTPLRQALQTVIDFLESDTPSFEGAPPCDLLVLMGNPKLDGAERAAKIYREGRAKKILVFANGYHNYDGKLARTVESYREVLLSHGVRGEDVVFENRRLGMEERLALVAQTAGQFGMEEGIIRFVGDSYSQKRLMLNAKKLMAQEKFPAAATLLYTPYYRIRVNKFKDKSAELKAAQKAVLVINSFEFGFQNGWHEKIEIPEKVIKACEVLSQALYTTPENGSDNIEKSI